MKCEQCNVEIESMLDENSTSCPICGMSLNEKENEIKNNENEVGKKSSSPAVSALKWAAGLTAGFVIGPSVVMLTNGQGDIGAMIAKKLVVGILQFPIFFFGIWAWGSLSKRKPLPDSHLSLTNTNKNKKPSIWNYISIFGGIGMLLFMFLPNIINGTLAGRYYLGVIFWVVVIIYSTLNILQARQ